MLFKEHNLSRPSSFLIIFLLVQHSQAFSLTIFFWWEWIGLSFFDLAHKVCIWASCAFYDYTVLLVLQKNAPRHLRMLFRSNLCQGHPNSRHWIRLPFRMSYAFCMHYNTYIQSAKRDKVQKIASVSRKLSFGYSWYFTLLCNISDIISRRLEERPSEITLSPPAELHHDKRASVRSLGHDFTA